MSTATDNRRIGGILILCSVQVSSTIHSLQLQYHGQFQTKNTMFESERDV